MKLFQNKMVRRKLISISLALLAGLLCVYLADKNSAEKIWGTMVMWAILYNRLLIGLFITFIGVFNWHGIFNLRYAPWLRGFLVGAVVSLDLAIGTLIAPTLPVDQLKMVFWSTILAGGFYGLMIDLIASKFGGEGKELLEEWAK